MTRIQDLSYCDVVKWFECRQMNFHYQLINNMDQLVLYLFWIWIVKTFQRGLQANTDSFLPCLSHCAWKIAWLLSTAHLHCSFQLELYGEKEEEDIYQDPSLCLCWLLYDQYWLYIFILFHNWELKFNPASTGGTTATIRAGCTPVTFDGKTYVGH